MILRERPVTPRYRSRSQRPASRLYLPPEPKHLSTSKQPFIQIPPPTAAQSATPQTTQRIMFLILGVKPRWTPVSADVFAVEDTVVPAISAVIVRASIAVACGACVVLDIFVSPFPKVADEFRHIHPTFTTPSRLAVRLAMKVLVGADGVGVLHIAVVPLKVAKPPSASFQIAQ
ncbi:MAG: hypothetical protein JWN04_1458 [Myxococcaceae bacterium]|nr:hypothetical protein [Myxococcaceae bacterium]